MLLLLVVTGPIILFVDNKCFSKATVEFVWVGWGMHSNFCIQPNYNVEAVLRLCCVAAGIVTKVPPLKLKKRNLRKSCSTQSCKKTFFVRYPDFQLINVRILYLLNFAII